MVDQKFPETDQKFPETGQFFFWSTKKNEKKTGQLVHQETDQNHMDGTIEKRYHKENILKLLFDRNQKKKLQQRWYVAIVI